MASLLKKILLTGVALLLCTSAHGEFYRYTDANGVVRFTDDIAAVPPEQRPNLKTYQSVKSDPVRAAHHPRPVDGAAALSALTAEEVSLPGAGTWQERVSAQTSELDRLQIELSTMYGKLQAERSALEATAHPAGSSAGSDAYRRRVDALNDRIDAYEARLSDYRQKERAFNRQYRK